MFGFMKEIIAAEFTTDWKMENVVKRLSYDEFAKTVYGINFNADLEPVQTVAIKDLKRVVDTLKRYEDQWQSVQNLTEAFQQMYSAVDQDEEQNQLTRLIERMFDKEKVWDPNSQGQSNYAGMCWGAEVAFRSYNTLGNWFLQGHIECTYYRVFKDHSNIGVMVSSDRDSFPDRYTTTLNVNDKAGLLTLLKQSCELGVKDREERFND